MYIADTPTGIFDKVAPRGDGAGALLRLALRPADGHHRLLSGSLQLDERTLKPRYLRHYAYPALVLAELWVPRTDAIDLLARLQNAEEDIQLPKIGPVQFRGRHANTRRYQSGANLGFIHSEWPLVYSYWYGKPPSNDQLDSGWERLLAPNLPIYPNENTAALSFVLGSTRGYERTDPPPLFCTYCEDRRARLSQPQLRRTMLTLHVEQQPGIDCRVLAYGDAVPEEYHHQGVPIRDGIAELPLEEVRGYVLIGLASPDGELLDERTVDFRSGIMPSSVAVAPEEAPQTLEITVRAWIDGGENEHVEFKQDYKGSNKREKDELLETVVAFANSGGGVILLGVDDNGTPRGFPKDKFADTLTDMVHSRCSPQPRYTVEEVNLEGVPLTLVQVAGRTPGVQYALDRDKFYVRVGATDRLARHEDLAALFQRPVEASPFPMRPRGL